MTKPSQHSEWLSLIDHSGPFLAIQVLEEAFPQGLEVVESKNRQRLRLAYEEWRDAVDGEDSDLAELHSAWIHLVLEDILEYDSTSLKSSTSAQFIHPENGVIVKPSFAVVSPASNHTCFFINVYPPDTDFDRPLNNDIWSASPIDRMTLLCRSANVQIGLITDGEKWTLINAPVNATSGYATWYARLWRYEPITLKAFQTLLGVRRCFGFSANTLESLLEKSLNYHEEITNTLGEQVRRAVEVLIQALDSADQERNRELLIDVSPSELYEAAVTIMMRLVFVLCAEERGLLLLGDPIYDQYYAITTLRAQLAEEGGRVGQEVLERTHDAWSRLLAVFRAIYSGIEHENLRLAPLGGSLFDPDRYPFLEGRSKGTHWGHTIAIPLPIDNRTVLLLLTALQILEQKTGALHLSYRALDVEQIGHVYEGLLECTVTQLPEITLAIIGSKQSRNALIPLAQLEEASNKGFENLQEILIKITQKTASSINKALRTTIDDYEYGKLLLACGGDERLALKIKPFYKLLRTDNWGSPLVYAEKSYAVTLGADRRETGTHYTPKSLTENIIKMTLEPLAYLGPCEGKPKGEWKLKNSADILNLKICDPAMGSAAFLVQACRWLGDRLVDAWKNEEAHGKLITITGEARGQLDGVEPLPTQLHERVLVAKKLVSERCLYGVDINPLAVELAKLSLWLITMSKGKPFEFLDHNLKCGDSLVGLHSIKQLKNFNVSLDDKIQLTLNHSEIEKSIDRSIQARLDIKETTIKDIRDVNRMVVLNRKSIEEISKLALIADFICGLSINCNGNIQTLRANIDAVKDEASLLLSNDLESELSIESRVKKLLALDILGETKLKKPFHWFLEFPEVFVCDDGFDAIIGNPPFLGGRKIRSTYGEEYLYFLTKILNHNVSANADLCAFFLLRANNLIKANGLCGFILSSSIAEGDTREVGLQNIFSQNSMVISAYSRFPWPGKANVTIAIVIVFKGLWSGEIYLNNEIVPNINSYLSMENGNELTPRRLKVNSNLSYQGSIPLGKGFVISDSEVTTILNADNKYEDVIYRYLVGQELNIDPNHIPSKWIINFHNWPLNREQGYKGPVAEDYPECLKIVKDKVFNERNRKKSNKEVSSTKPWSQKWWQYWRQRPELYEKLAKLPFAFAIATQATKYIAFGKVSGKIVFSHAISIIATNDYGIIAVLQSNIHEVWARKYGSYNLQLIRYSPTDLLETFPFPPVTPELRDLGRLYFDQRQKFMRCNRKGLTETYNCIHDKLNQTSDIINIRNTILQLDSLVLSLYGWIDIKLSHDFYETKQGIRFTIDEKSRAEIISRLLTLNHQCSDK
jgi:hypothetical protein